MTPFLTVFNNKHLSYYIEWNLFLYSTVGLFYSSHFYSS